MINITLVTSTRPSIAKIINGKMKIKHNFTLFCFPYYKLKIFGIVSAFFPILPEKYNIFILCTFFLFHFAIVLDLLFCFK